MISWQELVYNINELQKLENGGGSEIEFEYCGLWYIIVCYKGWFSLSKITDSTAHEYEEKIYSSIEELGSADDFGFCLEAAWDRIENVVCRPDFEDAGLQIILDTYKEAWNKRQDKKCKT